MLRYLPLLPIEYSVVDLMKSEILIMQLQVCLYAHALEKVLLKSH